MHYKLTGREIREKMKKKVERNFTDLKHVYDIKYFYVPYPISLQ
jgi:hypothetical protein